MNFTEIIKTRCAIRSDLPQKVEKEKTDQILEAAHAAPTAANRQPVRLIVIQSEEGLGKLANAANIYPAPLAILVCADHEKAWTRPYDQKQSTDIDASILTDHMMLQATELGLGTVWICHFKPDVIREEFSLPVQLEPVNILAIGYSAQPASDPRRHTSKRIPLEDFVSYETL